MGSHDLHHVMYVCLCVSLPSRAVSTTVDPFRDISLDLAPSHIINRTSTPFETNGKLCALNQSKCEVEWIL